MPTTLRRAVGTAVLLPGTGSDEVFVRSVFAGPLAGLGLRIETPRPRHGPGLVAAHLAAMDRAAQHGPILAGGVSLGAHLAVEWALAHPDRCAGLLLALPAWHGDPAGTPAALAALASATAVDAHGVDATLATATAGVPGWLADELTRAWRRAGAGLAESLRVAVGRPAPTLAELRRITAPAGIAACVDDPVHPVGVARAWATALPNASLRTITFGEFGADRASLGRAAVDGLDRAISVHDQVGDRDPGDHQVHETHQHQR